MPYSDDNLRMRIERLETAMASLLALLDAEADGLGISATQLTALRHLMAADLGLTPSPAEPGEGG
jgi:hypothetical protein